MNLYIYIYLYDYYYHSIFLLSLLLLVVVVSLWFLLSTHMKILWIVNIMYPIYVLCPARCTARPSLPKPIEGHGLLTGHNGPFVFWFCSTDFLYSILFSRDLYKWIHNDLYGIILCAYGFFGFARDFLWIHVDLSISSGDLNGVLGI